MMSYLDKTFCIESEKCGNKSCYRYFGEHQKRGASNWWGGFDKDGKSNAPVCMGSFFDNCDMRTARIDTHLKGERNEYHNLVIMLRDKVISCHTSKKLSYLTKLRKKRYKL